MMTGFVLYRRQGGHKEYGSNADTTATDASFSALGAAVTVIGGDTGESRDLFMFEMSELREITQKGIDYGRARYPAC